MLILDDISKNYGASIFLSIRLLSSTYGQVKLGVVRLAEDQMIAVKIAYPYLNIISIADSFIPKFEILAYHINDIRFSKFDSEERNKAWLRYTAAKTQIEDKIKIYLSHTAPGWLIDDN